ncbi:hypothetical protein [Oscillatoria acuminata]|nr:hypothetical protein [Oscillatoria acuminata]
MDTQEAIAFSFPSKAPCPPNYRQAIALKDPSHRPILPAMSL